MNFDKELYQKSEAKEFGEFENLELGGHEVVILDAREYKSDISGNTSLKISIDISGTDKQAGFFKKQYDDNTAVDKKWPTSAVRYLSLKDEQLAFLKGFITSLENSNSNFKFNINGTWDQLKGLKCAGVFGLEEYEKQDGSVGTTTKLTQFRSLDKLKDIKVPKVKLLSGIYMEYDDYKQYKQNVNNNTSNSVNPALEITGDMLPF